MATVQKIYEAMQRMAPLELAESWDNPGLLVDCGGEVSRVLVVLDVTAETLAEAEQNGCQLIVTHHPVIFHPLKKLSPADLPFQLVQKGISAICMHTNLDAAEGGVNEVLAGIFGMKNWEPFAGGCGRVGEVEPITVPELARKAQVELGATRRWTARKCRSNMRTRASPCGGWLSSAGLAAACLKRRWPWRPTAC